LTEEAWELAAWKPPLIVAAIAVSIVGGFYLGGPGLGMAVGAMAATAIVVMAIRHPPLHPIVPAAAADLRDHLLVVIGDPLEDAETIERIADLARGDESDRPAAEVLVVVPTRHRFLDRWTSDLGPARDRAQRTLVVSLASLARAKVAATAGIGDEDLVQTVEDRLRSYPASVVILVSDPADGDAAEGAARELKSRLRTPFHHLFARPAEHRTERPAELSTESW
jgi:hypothetical protein